MTNIYTKTIPFLNEIILNLEILTNMLDDKSKELNKEFHITEQVKCDNIKIDCELMNKKVHNIITKIWELE